MYTKPPASVLRELEEKKEKIVKIFSEERYQQAVNGALSAPEVRDLLIKTHGVMRIR